MGLLEGQRILLISPQPWDHIHLSKHHYALQLLREGNEVTFVDPPSSQVRGIRIDDVRGFPRLRVIRYSLAIPPAVRIHARPVFDLLFRSRISAIRRLAGPVDVVWCFEFNLFNDLRVFGADVNIFHPVDPVPEESHLEAARSADAVFSVSERILSRFSEIPVPRMAVNHGLAPEFAERAVARGDRRRKPGPPRVGYAGNLGRPPLDRAVLRRMVAENANAVFHFWGPRDLPPDPSAELSQEIPEFIAFLERAPNAIMHGTVTAAQLADQIQDMDCFVLCYTADAVQSDRSNSHKILEYLSTGNVVVSSRISSYAGRADLLRMAPGDDDSVLPEMLADTLARLEEFNSPELQEARRLYALDNTYEKQVDRIRTFLSALPTRSEAARRQP